MLPEFEFVEPKSIKKACQLLKMKGLKAYPIAGGTDLLVALKNRLKQPEILVDLKRLPHLNKISYSNEDGLKIGPLLSLQEVALNSIIKEKYPALSRAALEVGAPQLQNMGTIGGNLCQDTLCLYYNRPPMLREFLEPCHKLGGMICHVVKNSKICWATYCGDIAPVLLVFQAKVKIEYPQGEKIIPLNRFFSGDGRKPNRLKPGQIITELKIPPPSPFSGETYLKFRLRKAIDYPLLGVAIRLTMDSSRKVCKDAKLALTALGRAPFLIQEASELKGKELNDEVIDKLAEAAYHQAHPTGNISEVPPQYRKELVKVYVKLAFEEALNQAIQREVI